MGVVSDALTLAAALDTSIFVTRVNRTTKDQAQRALNALRGAGIDIAGLVVTGVKSRPPYQAKPADAAVPAGTTNSSVAPLDRKRASVPRTE
jgi:Mrp family chromosome partitioning ATPase